MLDFLRSPRFAARAAPAAICCFFDLAGILSLIACCDVVVALGSADLAAFRHGSL